MGSALVAWIARTAGRSRPADAEAPRNPSGPAAEADPVEAGERHRGITLEDGFDDIVGAARDGEEWALRAVYEALAPQVRGYLRAQGEAEPDELLGDVFLQLVRDFATFRGDESALRAWVLTIAHHQLVQRRGNGVAGVQPAPGGAGRTPLADSEQERLNTMLTGLSSDQRSVVLLRSVGELTVEQVGDVLGKTPGAVKRLQRQGLAALARHHDVHAHVEDRARRQPAALEPETDQPGEGSAAELTRLLESVAERARGLQRESENIVHRLEEAIAGIAAAANRKGERPAGRPLEREDVEAAEPARRRRSAPPSGVGAEEALLRATQMAIRGSRRAEIEAMLGDEFGVANPAEIVDQILGVGRR